MKTIKPEGNAEDVPAMTREEIRAFVGSPSVILPVPVDPLRRVVCRATSHGLVNGLKFNELASVITGHAVFGNAVLSDYGDNSEIFS